MATNKVQGKGTVIQYSNSGADIASGSPILLGDNGLHGLALEAIANGSSGSVEVPYPGPIISFACKGHNGSANTAIAIYDRVYFTAGDAFFDVDPAQVSMGFALGAVTSGATTTTNVLLCPAIA